MKALSRHPLVLLLALLTVIPLSACGGGSGANSSNTILVLADTSLKGAFTEIGQRIHQANPSHTVDFTFGSSKAMAQKAAAGDPGDAVALAGVQNMNSTQSVQLGHPSNFASKGSVPYQIVTLNQTKNGSLAQQFIHFVDSPTGQQILSQHGFSGP